MEGGNTLDKSVLDSAYNAATVATGLALRLVWAICPGSLLYEAGRFIKAERDCDIQETLINTAGTKTPSIYQHLTWENAVLLGANGVIEYFKIKVLLPELYKIAQPLVEATNLF